MIDTCPTTIEKTAHCPSRAKLQQLREYILSYIRNEAFVGPFD